ncbi:MAG: hypothetical protein AB8B89_01680 [Gammaproteobacteria bacterium]
MKNIFMPLMLLALVIGTTNAATITPDPSTDIPDGAVLFNFQVSEMDEGELTAGFMSQSNPGISITGVNVSGGVVSWLDDPFNDNGTLLPGGLGVCAVDNCAGNDSDALNQGETITLTISDPIRVGEIYFRNGNHDPIFEENFGVSIDGGAVQNFALASVSTALMSQVIESTIQFIRLGGPGSAGNASRDFYIAGFGAPVPLPAALPMMLMGLLGLFGFRKVTA